MARITYSRLINDFVADQARDAGVASNVFIKDGTEVHVGVQYTSENSKWLPRYRAGVWTNPDHSVSYRVVTPATSVSDRLTDEVMAVSLSTGARTVHYAAGLGLTINPRIEWNAGVDAARRELTISTSLILKLRQ